MNMKKKIGLVCFGEVNTPYLRLEIKHGHAVEALSRIDVNLLDAGIVTDDPEYKAADAAVEKLKGFDMDCLVICVAGWIPSHAVIRVTDIYRNVPMLLWGMCGWYENGHIVTTADQAGTTALRPAFEALDYRFKFIYSVMGEPEPIEKIEAFVNASYAVKSLRKARIGTMGYRDMLLYGTQYEGNSLRGQIGIEVEPFEMLEMMRNIEKLEADEVKAGISYVKNNWVFVKDCEDSIIETGVKYALAIGKKIKERGYDAVTLIDVDGMKKHLGFPPAMVFMLLDSFHGVETIPENDVMGGVTQLMVKYATGQTAAYLEYYEFFKNSVLIGVPDFIPATVTDGETRVLPTAFGLLSASLLNVSKVKTGKVTCSRLIYKKGKYVMHIYTGEAKTPPVWEECGWDAPAPQLPSLEVEMKSCTVEEFAQKVSSQHVIISYGDNRETLEDMCRLLNIEVI